MDEDSISVHGSTADSIEALDELQVLDEITDETDNIIEGDDQLDEEFDTRSEASSSSIDETSTRNKIKSERYIRIEEDIPTKKKPSEEYLSQLKLLLKEARFFIIKSNNYENIELAKIKNCWSTRPWNETKLNQAFRTCKNVILIFSVKESGKFAGFARISEAARYDLSPVDWVLLGSRNLSGVFKVDWITTKELEFNDTSHLYNAYNEGKTVKIARDGQEVDAKTGLQLCSMFLEDKSIDFQYILKKAKNHQPSISTAELRQRRRVLGLPDEGPTSKEYIHAYRFGIPHKQPPRMLSHPYYVRPPLYPSYQYNLSGSPMVQRYYDDVPLPPFRLPVHVPDTYARPLEDYYKRDRLVNLREYHSSQRREKERHTHRHRYH
ncbi:YTH domain-containing protein 1 [Metopolophium dirhodum]|uniref:YTH domain-containing protein 1 n=1 Tax=Metopolophium dirhodum TaxID=44670 RepID=UPI00298F7BC0|nr:YTH domain-containing protein 1 [Metopolophium dirhodum]XP_060863125.1 YTH domain-containing protein 1 [Metopolophium dirhodum]XP_060863126.1 YTH domain-containing protein 1 [Metopolophium dirhodum]